MKNIALNGLNKGNILDVHSDLLQIVKFLEESKTDSDPAPNKTTSDYDLCNSQTQTNTQPPI